MTSKLKIPIAIIAAIVIAHSLSQTVFFANTPSINVFFMSRLAKNTKNIINDARQYVASLTKKPEQTPQVLVGQFDFIKQKKDTVAKIQQLPQQAMNSIGKGVYAYSDTANNVIYIRVNKDVEYEERVLEYNGKKITVRFPKGTFK